MTTTAQALYKLLKSVRLAVVLLIVIAVAAIIATLIPQGREPAYYYAQYPDALASLVLTLQFDRFFSSLIFVTAILIFTVNLGVCTVDRITAEVKRRRKRRFGPDMIHVGLLILIVGGLLTFLGRREAFFYIAQGEEVEVAERYVVRLESYEFFTYETGAPKDWISTVDVFENGELIIDDFAIEVNNPLSIGEYDVFQSSYGNRARAELVDAAGTSTALDVGSFFRVDDFAYLFSGVNSDSRFPGGLSANFEEWQNQRVVGGKTLGPGQTIGPYTVGTIDIREVTGLQVVSDPGYLFALIGFILCVIGLTLTYAQKIGDKEI